MEQVLTITGKGKLSVSPDVICIHMNVRGIKESYEDAMLFASTSADAIATSLEPLGFQHKDLKTSHFDIHAAYESVQDRHGNYRNRLKGYSFDQEMKVEFLKDPQTLNAVLQALISCESNPELRLVYRLADEEAYKNELLARAVADSKKKAEVLAQAANVQLGNIVKIEYGWEDETSCLEPFDLCKTNPAEFVNVDFEPEDILLEDSVKVAWEIK